MNTRDKRQCELEGMTPLQLINAFEAAFSEMSVIGFPLKAYAINSIVQKEFNVTIPVPLAVTRSKRELASAK